MINENEQVFFAGNYQERINSPIITTGNELIKQQVADFSKQLNLEELYSYIFEVRKSTDEMLERLSYGELKKIPEARKGTAFPRPANSVFHSAIRQPVTHIPTTPTTTETDPFLPVI